MKKVLFLLAIVLFVYSAKAYDEKNDRSPHQVTLKVAINMPQGSFSDYWDTGYGFDGIYEYLLKGKIGLYGKVGYHLWSPITESSDFDFTQTIIPLNVGLNYYIGTKDFIPYITIEGGPNFLKYKKKDKHTDYEETSEDTYFGVSPGVGLRIPFGRSGFSAGLEGRYSMIMTDSDDLNNLVLNFYVSYRF